MEYIQLNIECTNCGAQDCRFYFNTATTEDHTVCTKCGYYHALVLKRDEEGELVLLNKDHGITDENIIIERLLIDKPFGYCEIAYSNNEKEGFPLPHEESYNELLRRYLKDDSVDRIILNRFMDGHFHSLRAK